MFIFVPFSLCLQRGYIHFDLTPPPLHFKFVFFFVKIFYYSVES